MASREGGRSRSPPSSAGRRGQVSLALAAKSCGASLMDFHRFSALAQTLIWSSHQPLCVGHFWPAHSWLSRPPALSSFELIAVARPCHLFSKSVRASEPTSEPASQSARTLFALVYLNEWAGISRMPPETPQAVRLSPAAPLSRRATSSSRSHRRNPLSRPIGEARQFIEDQSGRRQCLDRFSSRAHSGRERQRDQIIINHHRKWQQSPPRWTETGTSG